MARRFLSISHLTLTLLASAFLPSGCESARSLNQTTMPKIYDNSGLPASAEEVRSYLQMRNQAETHRLNIESFKQEQLQKRFNRFGGEEQAKQAVSQAMENYLGEADIYSIKDNVKLSSRKSRGDISDKLESISSDFKSSIGSEILKYLPNGVTVEDIDLQFSFQPIKSIEFGVFEREYGKEKATVEIEQDGQFMARYTIKGGWLPEGAEKVSTGIVSQAYDLIMILTGNLSAPFTPSIATMAE